MIIYDLECSNHHQFEGWFKNTGDYNEQINAGMLICPVCGSEKVKKIPSAHHISKTKSTNQKVTLDYSHQVLQKINSFVKNNFDDVGRDFPNVARKMHFGEIDERNIRGTATRDEVRELNEEGVDTIQLPPKPYNKDKLN